MREIFQDWVVETEIDGEVIELLMPEGLIEGIKNLGIDDLTEKDVKYLLRVLTKPELDGAIVMHELLQIMENLGLYDEDDEAADEQQEDDGEDDGEYNNYS